MVAVQSIDDYLTQLASSSATPGGGSAAMFVAASGVALLAMVARISAEKLRLTEERELGEGIARAADHLRERFLESAAKDEAAFEAVMKAQRRPRGDTERAAAVESALAYAADVPLQSAQRMLDALTLVRQTVDVTGENLMSDLGSAAEFLRAALQACAYTVRVNLRYMNDSRTIQVNRATLESIEAQSQTILKAVQVATEDALKGTA